MCAYEKPEISYEKELNPQQLEGVVTTEGPVLILAGAGSGKTRVLIHRLAYLIGECRVAPWNILAITFTNKAAQEMRERSNRLIGSGADYAWIATFHATCARILRRDIHRMGYDSSFTIYDADDQKALMRAVCKDLQIDTKQFPEKSFLGRISDAKDRLLSPVAYAQEADEAGGYAEKLTAQVYGEYQRRLKSANALDFDDLILITVQLLKSQPDVLLNYQNQFLYIMVDEYQDTNAAQFELVRLLAGTKANLCVVGDDDQSIYRFRGADIRNILDFERHYPGAHVIRLEQNYRSTKNILNAANAVIANNEGRKRKTLWTDNDTGLRITYEEAESEYEEAQRVAARIRRKTAEGSVYTDFAVLYRTNAQSRALEEGLMGAGIPYRIVGGVNFYARREIKDMLAYLHVIDNPADEVSLRRILNVPRRGIGDTSVGRIAAFAAAGNMSLFEAVKKADTIPGAGRAGKAARILSEQLTDWRVRMQSGELLVSELIDEILEVTGYRKGLEQEETVEAGARLENLEELINKAADYEDRQQFSVDNDEETAPGSQTEAGAARAVEKADEAKDGGTAATDDFSDVFSDDAPEAVTPLTAFLSEVSLVADIDTLDPDAECVLLMTLHAAKGLEFPCVFITGLEEGLFPSAMGRFGADGEDEQKELEEERRLCYVGITRAERELFLLSAKSRMSRGERRYSTLSRFVEEIPPELVEGSVWAEGGRSARRENAAGGYGGGFSDGRLQAGLGSGTSGAYGRRYQGDGTARSGGSGFSGRNGDAGFALRGSGARASSLSGSGSYKTGTSRPAAGSLAYSQSSSLPPVSGRHRPAPDFSAKLEKTLPDYEPGDRVRHQKFGEGTVLSIADGGRDYEVTVDFDAHGTKKMFAAFARLVKVK